MNRLDIRTMSAGDLEYALEWAAREGWNPGLFDAAAFHAADPEGFLAGYLGGEQVGCISAVRYAEDFGFIGLYIVRPESRGQGLGMQLWREAMRRLAGRNAGLDGVVAQEENYRKSGFELAHRNVRFEGWGGGEAQPGPFRLADVAPEELLAYDAEMFARPRPEFLSHWSRHSASHGAALRRGGKLVGYGVLRPCREGWKVGPLFADDPSAAEAILSALASKARGEKVFLDCPEPNAAAAALAAKYRMKPVFETARMYTHGDPGVPLERVFGITSFELG